METHRRLAPCPAALEDRELGPSTGIELKIEDREEWVEIMGGGGVGVLVTWLLYRWDTRHRWLLTPRCSTYFYLFNVFLECISFL